MIFLFEMQKLLSAELAEDSRSAAKKSDGLGEVAAISAVQGSHTALITAAPIFSMM
jgi:hypothetical protein